MPQSKAYVEAQARFHRKRKENAVAYKGGKCARCNGVFHYCVYDFHHRDPKNKSFNVKTMTRYKWERVQEELDKCDLLCANCHRMVERELRGEG